MLKLIYELLPTSSLCDLVLRGVEGIKPPLTYTPALESESENTPLELVLSELELLGGEGWLLLPVSLAGQVKALISLLPFPESHFWSTTSEFSRVLYAVVAFKLLLDNLAAGSTGVITMEGILRGVSEGSVTSSDGGVKSIMC